MLRGTSAGQSTWPDRAGSAFKFNRYGIQHPAAMQCRNVASAIDSDHARMLLEGLAVGGRAWIYAGYIYPRIIIGTGGLYLDD